MTERQEPGLAELKADYIKALEIVNALRAERDAAEGEQGRLLEALRSIAANSCCTGCQEAALVARAALEFPRRDRSLQGATLGGQ